MGCLDVDRQGMIEKRPRILVVEDEESLLSTVRDELEAAGFDVEPAVTGEEALRKVREQLPDLVLLDLLLPGVGGLGVLANLKSEESTRDIPVVMLTNIGDDAKVYEALELGAEEYFIKTRYDLKDILERLHVILKTGRG